MRILIVGAGATGGYFGGRLLEAGRDVTFLVRPARAAALATRGLVIHSPRGDYRHPRPPVVTAEQLSGPYDLVLLACKAYDLDGAIASFAPAVGPATTILPLLNGLRHLDRLDARFGLRAALGGQCVISAALDPDGAIRHLNEAHALSFGERDGSASARVAALAEACAGARFEARPSGAIVQEMWDKWVFIAALAGSTCLLRATVGDIVAAGGAELAVALHEECAAIAAGLGHPMAAATRQRNHALLTTPGSSFAASMLRDIERGGPTEGEHVLTDLLRRAAAPPPLLRIAAVHVAAYEARRRREHAPSR
ncbi:MAG: 2-dehydropantoate 2-reductase [Proteobacteria bacterium]|nr:2-dehydropantoate 2-reductase [Pseudomonadota bacterium]